MDKISQTQADIKELQPDESQQQVINAKQGFHLVLAPPGCGKTHILAERICKAREAGIPFSDMLCLTFTNRAARGMTDRIIQRFGESISNDELFVGNVHRFCARFLFESSILTEGTSIIDDDDAISIIADYANQDEEQVKQNPGIRKNYSNTIFLSHLIFQINHQHERSLRMHPECINAEDITAMQALCKIHRKQFTPEAMNDIYCHADFYRDDLNLISDLGLRANASRLLERMQLANNYETYKMQNMLVDFEDLLLLTYEALRNADTQAKRYSWIQVDEVQDLNALQMAIIDLLTDQDATPTVMYLGDAQQAIFSFMGAKLDILDTLRKRCQGNIHHLTTNHRSPSYLLDIYNQYAQDVLGVDSQLLPKPRSITNKPSDHVGLITCADITEEYNEVAHFVETLQNEHPDNTTAVIVSSNADAEQVSAYLNSRNLPHFKVSGTDFFATDEMKLLIAHFNVINDQHNFISWARIIKGLGLLRTAPAARTLMAALRQRAILPTDLFLYDGTTYVQEFFKHCQEQEVIVFDTETTGLDTQNDEIIQIAAVKMRSGKIVEGSNFNVFMQTTRPIPEMLGDIKNPILEEIANHELLSQEEGIKQFLQYVSGSPLIAHNAEFDINILKHSISRVLDNKTQPLADVIYFDSLCLSRLLLPNQVQYKLKHLIQQFNLQGENAHLADADVEATTSLIALLLQKAEEIIPSQQQFLIRPKVVQHSQNLKNWYLPIWQKTKEAISNVQSQPNQSLTELMDYAAQSLLPQLNDEMKQKLQTFFRFIENDMITVAKEPTIRQQLQNHILQLNTMKEADLCNSNAIAQHIFVTTVHKAKGLEFDNVIVFDAVDGRYPNYHSRNNPRQRNEDARKFYVAITRAKQRLFVSWAKSIVTQYGNVKQKALTPFIQPIIRFFD